MRSMFRRGCIANSRALDQRLIRGVRPDGGVHEVLHNQAVLESNVSRGVNLGFLHMHVEGKIDNLLPDRVFGIGPKLVSAYLGVRPFRSRTMAHSD
jgi:hypothetical protein